MPTLTQSPATREPGLFHDGQIYDVDIKSLDLHADDRGWLVELFRNDRLHGEDRPAMAYISLTLPGVARGPHQHAQQTDHFAFIGPGRFALYLWDIRTDSPTWARKTKIIVGESNRRSIVVPPGVVHAYKNIGATSGWVFNAPNRLYAGPGKRQPVDEIRHEDQAESIYRLD